MDLIERFIKYVKIETKEGEIEQTGKELEEAKKGKEVKTGGMLYYNIKNPLIERDKVSDGDIDTAILKELKPEGLINSDIEVLKMFDKNLTAGVKSDVVPVAINKDGRLSSYSKATDEAKFDMMCKFAKDKIKEFGKDILDGKADVNPYRKDSKRRKVLLSSLRSIRILCF